MASSMFESILGMVTPEMAQSMASRFGESSSAVQHGLSAATAATLTGMARNAGDSGFTDQILQMAGRAGGQNIASNIASMASGGPSGATGDLVSRFSSLVFGSQQGQMANLVSQHSGVSGSAGTGILKMAGGLVLAYLAKAHSTGSLNAGSLASTLRTEASNLGNYVPGSFLANMGGGASDTTTRAPPYVSNVIHTQGARPPTAGTRWIVPAAAAVLGALLLGWLLSRFMRTTVPAPVQTASNYSPAPYNATAPAPAPAAGTPSLGAPESISLPDGTQLSVPSDGVEAKLVRYLQDPNAQANSTAFDFDRLLFDTGSATLQPQSSDQLDNIAAILKAYPSAKINLGGYADSTGDAAENAKLSTERADNVMAALVQRGIDPSRLSAQGFGQESPVANNGTEEGRQNNRRVSIRVAEK
jgi:OmpA-OmpF porin, OOP family